MVVKDSELGRRSATLPRRGRLDEFLSTPKGMVRVDDGDVCASDTRRNQSWWVKRAGDDLMIREAWGDRKCACNSLDWIGRNGRQPVEPHGPVGSEGMMEIRKTSEGTERYSVENVLGVGGP
jgi:hypothetical protein